MLNTDEVEQQHISPIDDAVIREPSPFLNDSEKSLSEENHSLSENGNNTTIITFLKINY